MKRFALIGVGGYVAPRHLKAIKDTGSELLATLDSSDSVGVLDGYFPEAKFFTEFERFDRHLEKLRRRSVEHIDYVTVCSPNYLHDAHVRFALRIGADAICEKPLVLNPWNIEALAEIESETSRTINTILQLRLHPAITALRRKIVQGDKDKIYDIDLTYITARGPWYQVSWKGDVNKSGGVATNIGVHFFDMLCWIFGPVRENIVHCSEPTKAAGLLHLEQARIRWFLSLDTNDLPVPIEPDKPRTYRSITINGEEIDFTGSFTDLHTESYREILKGNGFRLADVLPSIEIVSDIRRSDPIGLKGDYHPLLRSNATEAKA